MKFLKEIFLLFALLLVFSCEGAKNITPEPDPEPDPEEEKEDVETGNETFRVFPTIGQSEATMFDKSKFPFISENADGFNLPYVSFGLFSEGQVATLFEQFKNKNFINHGVYKESIPITSMSTMNKMPSTANVTAFMLYSEAPAMSTAEWKAALEQDVDWPLLTHCRTYSKASTSNAIREQIQMCDGIMMEFKVTEENKFQEAMELLIYCVDNDKIVSFLTTFQETPDTFIAAYRNFYYYLKKNLPSTRYLKDENVIFIPNTYSDDQVLPETSGYGSTFGVAHWLIDQKKLIDDGYIEPKVAFSNVKNNDFFHNHHNLEVKISVDRVDEIASADLYVNDKLVGTDTAAPFEWQGGELDDLTTGYKNLKVVAKTKGGQEVAQAIVIRILGDHNVVPGEFQAGDMYDCQLRNLPGTNGVIRHCYGKEWVDYQLDVKHAGSYDVEIGIMVQRSKQFGGTIILKSGSKELGRFTTITNKPSEPALPGFTENPEVIIKDVELEAGEQILRVTFEHPSGIVQPQFYLYDFNFIYQAGADIAFTAPKVNESTGVFDSYDAPANIYIAADVNSSNASVESVELFVGDKSAGMLTQAPFEWNKNGDNAVLKAVSGGTHTFKIVATDTNGVVSFEEITLKVVAREPFAKLTLPGTVPAWQYNLGGEGVGYHDFNKGHERGLGGKQNPRYELAGDDDVEIEMIAGKECVSAIRRDEWLYYTVSSIEAGTYDVSLLASANTGKTADVKIWLNNELLTTVKTTETGTGKDFTVFEEFTSEKVVIKETLTDANIRLEFINPSISTYLMFLRSFSFNKVD